MTPWWARWRLKSPASRLFTQPFIRAQIKVNIKAPRHWPLCGEFTGDRWIPPQMASNAENVSIWWRHHEYHDCYQGTLHRWLRARLQYLQCGITMGIPAAVLHWAIDMVIPDLNWHMKAYWQYPVIIFYNRRSLELPQVQVRWCLRVCDCVRVCMCVRLVSATFNL